MSFKWIAVGIVTLVYLYNLLLKIVRMRSAKNPIPANVADVYDEETYRKWRAYHAEKSRFAVAADTAAYLIELALLVFNVYAAFAGLFPKTDFLQLFAVLLLSGAAELLKLPFVWHDTMRIEGKYGFNTTKPATFWGDQIKSFLIELILMTGVGAVLMWLHRVLGDWLILAFAGLMTVLVLVIAFLYPVLGRIFNKFESLEEGELRAKLSGLLEKNGYRVRDIKVMDASRRSTKSNAYFTGFGKLKTIVLYDTLVKSMSTDEICAVFAHELGHGLHRDTLKRQILTFVQMVVLGVLAWLTLRTADVFASFGFTGVNYGFALILIMSVEFALIAPLFELLSNYISRKAEYRADAHAVSEGYAADLISALKKLARENYAELAPSPLLVRLEYTHPPISARIEAIEKAANG